MKQISSRDNPFFKEMLKLAGSARQRRKAGQTLLDGIHLIQAYLASGQQPLHLLVTATALQDVEVATLLKKSPAVQLTQLDDNLFAELSELKTPSGILALIEQPLHAAIPVQSHFCLLLEDIQDPGNLGSMLRSAAAAGCDAVFLSGGCADAWSPKVLRAGMGGHFALRPSSGQALRPSSGQALRQGSGQALRQDSGLPMGIHESADLLAVAAAFRGKVLAASPAAQTSLYECDLRGDVAFAIGNEGAGLSEELRAACQSISIPMAGQVESLNAAAAAAVCLFEAARQRSQLSRT